MYKTVFFIIKYGHNTKVTFEFDYKISALEATEIRSLLTKYFDCDDIHIRILLLNDIKI